MALLQYFTSIPKEQLSNPEGSLSVVVLPAAIHSANDCVRQIDKGAKKKRGSYAKLSSENEPRLANMHLTMPLLPQQGTKKLLNESTVHGIKKTYLQEL